MGFMDLEKAYDRINREALWQVVRMYNREKGDERECLGSTVVATGMYHVPLAFQCTYG